MHDKTLTAIEFVYIHNIALPSEKTQLPKHVSRFLHVGREVGCSRASKRPRFEPLASSGFSASPNPIRYAEGERKLYCSMRFEDVHEWAGEG